MQSPFRGAVKRPAYAFLPRSPKARTAGHRRACVRCAKLGSLSAPRLCGDYFAAHAVRLTSVSAAPRPTRKIRPGPSSPGRQRVRTPEAGPLAGRRWSGLAICLGPLLSAGTSGAATLVPRSRRSAARVLMDEGWRHSTGSSSCGDNVRIAQPTLVIPAEAGIQKQA